MNRRLALLAFSVASLAAPRAALANGFEFPSNGTESFARGSAWLARAADPLAVYNNPAALARNGSAVSVSANIIWQKACFQRRAGGSDPVTNGVTAGEGSQLYYQSCNDGDPFPNPQIAFQYRLTDKLGIGFAALGPSAYGKTAYPTFVQNTSLNPSTYGQAVPGPAGSRYMVTNVDNIVAWPQVGVGYEVAKNIRVGASFIWGVARMKFGSVAMGFNSGQGPDGNGRLNEKSDQDVEAQLEVKDWFVPGFVLSSLATVVDTDSSGIDVAGWFHWSDAINATGKATLTAFVYDSKLQQDNNPSRLTTGNEQVTVKAPQPWEIRAGIRYYKKRPIVAETVADGAALPGSPRHRMDPLRDEVFDIELDLEYSRDSQFQNLGVSFNPQIQDFKVGAPPAAGEEDTRLGVQLPADASVPHKWKDSFGLRLGGDYAVLPGRLALRAGAWFQTANVEAKDMHLDFIGAQRLGLTAGGTVRVGPVDVQVGYGHIFFKTLDNGGNGALRATTGSASPQLPGTPAYRSDYAINGGQIKAKADIVSLGLVARWLARSPRGGVVARGARC